MSSALHYLPLSFIVKIAPVSPDSTLRSLLNVEGNNSNRLDLISLLLLKMFAIHWNFPQFYFCGRNRSPLMETGK